MKPVLQSETVRQIETSAVKNMRKWERSYACQDINERHELSWWIAQETAMFLEGWQPIETAPTNAVFLVWVDDDYIRVYDGEHNGEKRLYDYHALVDGASYIRVTGATHWRPDLKGPENECISRTVEAD